MHHLWRGRGTVSVGEGRHDARESVERVHRGLPQVAAIRCLSRQPSVGRFVGRTVRHPLPSDQEALAGGPNDAATASSQSAAGSLIPIL